MSAFGPGRLGTCCACRFRIARISVGATLHVRAACDRTSVRTSALRVVSTRSAPPAAIAHPTVSRTVRDNIRGPATRADRARQISHNVACSTNRPGNCPDETLANIPPSSSTRSPPAKARSMTVFLGERQAILRAGSQHRTAHDSDAEMPSPSLRADSTRPCAEAARSLHRSSNPLTAKRRLVRLRETRAASPRSERPAFPSRRTSASAGRSR